MFTGHYAAAFALKGKENMASLGMLFIATQFVDILFFPLVVLGVERLKLEDNFSAVNNYNLEFMPFTHGLLGSLVWALIFYLIYYFLIGRGKKDGKPLAMVMALGVFSHWFADLIAHTPDLPLISGEPKFGFGLWRNKLATFLTEAGLLIISLIYYLKNVKDLKQKSRNRAIGLVFFLILLDFLSFYVLPPEKDIMALCFSALASYGILAGLAFWVDKK